MVSDSEIEKAGRIAMAAVKTLAEAVGEGSEHACGEFVKLSQELKACCRRLAKQKEN